MENKKNSLFSESLILAAIPFLGYITVFVYELGFLTYFGIPYEFIQPTFTGVCLVTAVIIGVLLFSFVSGHCFTVLLTTIFPIKDGPFLRAIKRIAWQVFALLFFVIFWGKEWKQYLGPIMIFSMVVFFEFLWPLVTGYKKKSYNEKLAHQENIERKYDPEFRIFFNFVDEKIGRRNVAVFLTVALFLLFVYQAGLIKAKQKDAFWQIDGEQSIVLRIYGDTLICANFDTEKHVISNQFSVVKISPEKKLSLKMIKTGRLKSNALFIPHPEP